MTGNGSDQDTDERANKALLVARLRAESEQRIAKSEALAESLRMNAPHPDARPWEAPPAPDPEPQQETQASIAAAIAVLRGARRDRNEDRIAPAICARTARIGR